MLSFLSIKKVTYFSAERKVNYSWLIFENELVQLWLPITALGLFYFGKEGLSWNHLKTDLAQARQENAAL